MIDKQSINGNNNNQASGDITINNFTDYMPKAIHFYEQDIKDVIEEFSGGFSQNVGSSRSNAVPFDYIEDFIEKEEKNRLNSLSDDYFRYILDEHLSYFYKIDGFLKDPKNNKLLDKYKTTAFEINFQIQTMRSQFSTFDEVLGSLYNGLLFNNSSLLSKNRDLYIVFFNYMYWNCDIGKKR